jgi:large subunit ribosomal protein L9
MGDVVAVKPGYARNYLLPQKKALRASKDNVAFFEAQKKHLVAENDKRKGEAEKLAKKIDGIKVALIRQASEGGQLFGSVAARDIASEASKVSGVTVDRAMVQINQNFKLIGLFPVTIALHPEVKVTITINIARSVEEADTQAKTGKALIAGESDRKAKPDAPEADLEGVLEEGALEAQKQKRAEADAEAAEDAADDEVKAAKRAKKAEKAKSKKSDDAETDAVIGRENLPED